MGWGSGAALKEVLKPATGDVVHIDAGYNPFAGRKVLIDISGLAHKASKKQARQVALEGTSQRQQQYVLRHLEALVAEGGTPVLVLDGRAYPPKAAERAKRRSDRAGAVQKARQAEQAGDVQLAAKASLHLRRRPHELRQ